LLLALETSCDETAAAVCDAAGRILASEISSQIEAHRPFGGVVPEVASRSHLQHLRPLIERTLAACGVEISRMEAFAATAGPGLASSLLIGHSVAKGLALALGRPFLAINHLEGHLLSPFIGRTEGVRPGIALVVSGGHTLLVHLRAAGDYQLLGRTRDDAAGEAFDKAAKMLGLPYPGGPQIDRVAKDGNPEAYDFPRSMAHSGDLAFSFSGLKTSLLYLLPKLGPLTPSILADVCASFQQAIVDVLVEKTVLAAHRLGQKVVGISGGVSCNSRLRECFARRCRAEGLELLAAAPEFTTDNAAMIAFAAVQKWKAGLRSSLDQDVDPNLPLETAPAPR
jgi:N6-L-threonylcarbamoyladenine synthase